MSSATKTIRQRLEYRQPMGVWFAATQTLFNAVAHFYFAVIQAHPGVLELSNQEALSELERLTHATKDHPAPIMPLSEISGNIPAMFRRAAINTALGSARSFYTHLDQWRRRKEKAQLRGKPFPERPPVPPRTWNKSVILYAGQWKERTTNSLMLKLWTGTSWCWLKVRLAGLALPDGWEAGSPSLVLHGRQWWLHTPIEKQLASPGKVEKQVTTHPDLRICGVDLNIKEHLAVCTIQTREGTVLATRFIGGGCRLHGLRKSLLGRIARLRDETGLLASGEQDNARLWAKITHLNAHTAHTISHHIVAFAQEHGAKILVFEHLGHFRPQKGKYSKRGNEKRAYWLRGRIFQYTKYKAWAEGMLTCRVNPKDTSRECAHCHSPVARYDERQPPEGYTPGAPLVYCPACRRKDNADRNASLVIGQRLLKRYHHQQTQEKPPTRHSAGRRSKERGVSGSQDAKSSEGPSLPDPARHGARDGQGTAQDQPRRMGSD